MKRVKFPFFLKLFSGYLLIIIVFAVLLLFVSFLTVKKYYIETLSHDLEITAITLSLQFTSMLDEGKGEEIDNFAKEIGNRIGVRITVIKPDGKVIADSEKNPEEMENHRHRPEIRNVLKGKEMGSSLRFSRTVKREMLYVAIPLRTKGKIIGVLRTSIFTKDIYALISGLKTEIVRVSIAITLASLFFAFIFSRTLTHPLNQVVEASRKVSEGDLDVKIFFKQKDEFKELADTFNRMTTQIKKLFKEVSSEREQLKVLISSIHEGFVVINKEGKINLANEAFKEIVKTEDVKGKFYWEVVKSSKFIEFAREAKEEGKTGLKEISLGSEHYLCSLTTLPEVGEVIILLLNITEMKRLQEIKRNFVINASHEFKTPLTAIKGFIEMLEEKENIKNKEYLDIIKRNTDRLINIINDLLLLARLEFKEIKFNFEKINLNELLKSISEVFEPLIKKKGLSIMINIGNDFPEVIGDRYMIEQVFVNLIDNAVKYTEKGSITVRAKKEGEFGVIEVEDTGIGISEEDIPRVFERFYVVDKSRSHQLGGTGLGLSIVKHAVLRHNGEVRVKSKVGKGSTFIVKLPISPK